MIQAMRTSWHGIVRLGIALTALMLAACATSPPAQQMAAARAAIQTAKSMPGESPEADRMLHSAEEMLDKAARAIDEQRFEEARQRALRARREAQRAARIKQRQQHREKE